MIQEDGGMILGLVSMDQTTTSGGKGGRKKVSYSGDDNDEYNSNIDGHKKKKIIHRDIERQRRQEMATLYSSLRQLLPLQFVKGKRSISDHMNEAVNYIKHLEKNIKELAIMRDHLKRSNSPSPENKTTSSSSNQINITVQSRCYGVEILISSGLLEKQLPLSKVLKVLNDEGLDVITCVVTEVNEYLLSTLQCKIGDAGSVDISDLQQKLAQLVP